MTRQLHRAVSLFSNCGAGDVGYAKAGFHFDVMAEIDERRLEVCLLNHPTAVGVPHDLRKTWPEVVSKYRKRAGDAPLSLLAACPPCQGMSSARSDRGLQDDPEAGAKDDRNLLVTVISSVTNALTPSLVVVENVQEFLTRKIPHPVGGVAISAASYLIEQLQEHYLVFPMLADLCDFGVPQHRKRTFLTFVRRCTPALEVLAARCLAPYPIPTYATAFGGTRITLRQALASFKLPPLDARSAETAVSRHGGGLHRVPVWLDRRYRMVAGIPAYSGGSAWDNDTCATCGKVDPAPNAALCPRCRAPLPRPVVKAKNGRYRLVNGFRGSTYARMKPDAPSATITTASGHVGSNNTIHPFENRVLSPLECALLQTFPRRFRWGEALAKWGHTNVRDMIGEAVPPLFTRLHGKTLLALLTEKKRARMLPAKDRRCVNARAKLGLVDTPE